jgi:SOS-response transcriptional repressor LexA
MTKRDRERDAKIVAFVCAYRADHFYGPSLSEIAHAVGLSFRPAARYHVRALRDRGELTFDERDGRMVPGSIR